MQVFPIISKGGTKINFECKELIDIGVCDEGFISNRSNSECECYNSCDVTEYLDYENCMCRKKLVDKLVEECTEIGDEVKMAKIKTKTKKSIKINWVLAHCTLRYFL